MRQKTPWLVALAVIALPGVGCQQSATPPGPPESTAPFRIVKGQGVEGVIVPAGAAAATGLSKEGYWTPTEAAVLQAERGLGTALEAEQDKRGASIAAALPRYRRQYFGILDHGKQVLVISGSCRWPSSWMNQPLIVHDGGQCFFQAWFDTVSGKFVSVSINGEA